MKVNLRKEVEDCITELIKDNVDVDEDYCSILEYLDGKFDRDFYKRIDANELIHERMRYELHETGNKSTLGCWLLSGIMECYDFVRNTDDKDLKPNNGSITECVYDD